YKLLLNYDINTNIANKNGDTPIKLIFVKNDHTKWKSMCNILLKKSSSKINLNFHIHDHKDDQSSHITPLIWACRENYSTLIKLMLRHDINVNYESQDEIN